ncbi:S24 family peptidase [Stenotrophomonas sepilia]|uniref:S24 family peptidase n=1 Tax=Stenotrophomonas sepilia TaxID=2860290 RepID=UPI0035581A1A
MDIKEIRTRNFRHLISALEGRGVTRRRDQGAQLGGFLSASYVSQLLGGKYIGDDVAKKISAALNKDSGWMDRPQWGDDDGQAISPIPENETPPGYVRFDLFEGGAGMGAGMVNQDYPEVVKTIEVAEWEVRRKLGYLPQPGRIQIITGRGPSMRPKLEDGDIVWIDTSCDYFDGDDYYLINIGGETQIKMLQKRGDGLYVVSVNTDFPAYRPDPGDVSILGKALIHAGLRKF